MQGQSSEAASLGKRKKSIGVKPKKKKVDPLKLMEEKELIKERGILLSELDYTPIPAKVQAMGWMDFVRQSRQINRSWVNEFYAAARYGSFEEEGVIVRNRLVRITREEINAYYNIQGVERTFDPAYEEITLEHCEILRRWFNPNKTDVVLDSSHLEAELAFWNTWQRFSLLPQQKSQEPNLHAVQVLHHLRNALPFDVGFCVMRRIKGFLVDKSSKFLCYPSLITHFCSQAGVLQRPNDVLVAPGSMIGSWNYKTSVGARGGKPSIRMAYWDNLKERIRGLRSIQDREAKRAELRVIRKERGKIPAEDWLANMGFPIEVDLFHTPLTEGAQPAEPHIEPQDEQRAAANEPHPEPRFRQQYVRRRNRVQAESSSAAAHLEDDSIPADQVSRIIRVMEGHTNALNTSMQVVKAGIEARMDAMEQNVDRRLGRMESQLAALLAAFQNLQPTTEIPPQQAVPVDEPAREEAPAEDEEAP